MSSNVGSSGDDFADRMETLMPSEKRTAKAFLDWGIHLRYQWPVLDESNDDCLKRKKKNQNLLQSEKKRQQRSTETDAKKHKRLVENKIRTALSRQTESQEEKRDRIANDVIRRKRRRCLNWENVGYKYDPFEHYHLEDKVQIHGMTVECNFCHALKWADETKGMCCKGGKVSLQHIGYPPEPLKSLLSGENSESKHFL